LVEATLDLLRLQAIGETRGQQWWLAMVQWPR
jgi:hypothetical protein